MNLSTIFHELAARFWLRSAALTPSQRADIVQRVGAKLSDPQRVSSADERWLFGERREWGPRGEEATKGKHIFLHIGAKGVKHYFLAANLADARGRVAWGLQHNWSGMLLFHPGKVNGKTQVLPRPSRLIRQSLAQRARSSR